MLCLVIEICDFILEFMFFEFYKDNIMYLVFSFVCCCCNMNEFGVDLML